MAPHQWRELNLDLLPGLPPDAVASLKLFVALPLSRGEIRRHLPSIGFRHRIWRMP